MNSKNYIDQVQQWLAKMGFYQLTRESDNMLKAKLTTESGGTHYTVIFYTDGSDVFIESPVFKTVSGDLQNVVLFYETLLAYNASISHFQFGMVKSGNDSMLLILRNAQKGVFFKQIYFMEIFKILNLIYSEHVPRLKKIAQDFDLTFDGILAKKAISSVSNVLNP